MSTKEKEYKSDKIDKKIICVILLLISFIIICVTHSLVYNHTKLKTDEETTIFEVITELNETTTDESTTLPLNMKKLDIKTQTNIIELTETKLSIPISSTFESSPSSDVLYSASKFMYTGVIYWNGWKWTYYSERILPGGGLNIPGRHNDADGYICDENGYICLSSSSLSKGTVIDTPFGKQGMVYDTGCPYDVIDVYVNW